LTERLFSALIKDWSYLLTKGCCIPFAWKQSGFGEHFLIRVSFFVKKVRKGEAWCIKWFKNKGNV
jgi:hypothetical protein